jgi:hypothetical protein
MVLPTEYMIRTLGSSIRDILFVLWSLVILNSLSATELRVVDHSDLLLFVPLPIVLAKIG